MKISTRSVVTTAMVGSAMLGGSAFAQVDISQLPPVLPTSVPLVSPEPTPDVVPILPVVAPTSIVVIPTLPVVAPTPIVVVTTLPVTIPTTLPTALPTALPALPVDLPDLPDLPLDVPRLPIDLDSVLTLLFPPSAGAVGTSGASGTGATGKSVTIPGFPAARVLPSAPGGPALVDLDGDGDPDATVQRDGSIRRSSAQEAAASAARTAAQVGGTPQGSESGTQADLTAAGAPTDGDAGRSPAVLVFASLLAVATAGLQLRELQRP